MRDGLLQQVDTPQQIYGRPANLFVAEFIGSPAMNLVRAALARDQSGWTARFGDLALPVPETTLAERPGLARYEGREVVLGIRPEDFDDAGFARNGSVARISVVTDIREDVGPEVFVHFSAPGTPVRSSDLAAARDEETLEAIEERARRRGIPFVARVDRATAAREGEPIELTVDVARLHYFDPESGEAIAG
jgi:multiple sugar transport system ATP-binding protein